MPDVPTTRPRPRHGLARGTAVLSLGFSWALLACGGGDELGAVASAMPSAGPEMTAMASERPLTSDEMGADLCAAVSAVEQQLSSLRAVELRLPNRVALDIELGKLEAAFGQLRQSDLGVLEGQLETPLTRLGHRLVEVELAVEDFRTNPRPRRAAPHVEADSATFGEELAAFSILARCSRR